MTPSITSETSVLQAIFDRTRDAILLTDDGRRYVDVNPAACELLGYSREELLTLTLEDLTPAPDRDEIPGAWAEFLRAGALEGDYRLLRKDGTTVPVHFRAVASILPGVHLSIMRDLRARAALDAELRASEERLRRILDNTSAVIYLIDEDGHFITVNRAYERVFGIRREEIAGRAVEACFPPDVAVRMLENNRRVLRENAPVSFEETVPGPAGDRIYLSLKFPIGNDGHPDALCGISIDITERVRAEAGMRADNVRLAREVEAGTRALERSLTELSRFASTVAHDLRAPLRAMAGLGQILLNDYRGRPLDEEGSRIAERIVDGARRLDGMIHDLLGYMSLERAPLRPARIETGEVIAKAVRELAPRLEWRRAEIECEAPLAPLHGDATALRTAVAKLLDNAATHVGPGVTPRIRIRTERRDARVRLWIEDNGIGISPEHHERIFGVFERLGRIEDVGGHGMGLAIAKREIERQGGRIGLESAPGHGSRFWIELPVGEH